MRLAVALAIALAGAAVTSARADPPELVGEVQAAGVGLGGPGTVIVCARGFVPTGGYAQPRLTPARSPGRAGVYDVDFTAVRPQGMATQMVSTIAARFRWRGAPDDLKGVRVRGDRGSRTAMLGAGGGC